MWCIVKLDCEVSFCYLFGFFLFMVIRNGMEIISDWFIVKWFGLSLGFYELEVRWIVLMGYSWVYKVYMIIEWGNYFFFLFYKFYVCILYVNSFMFSL